eukprot:8267679-Pyramimonas_sp.AAC.1
MGQPLDLVQGHNTSTFASRALSPRTTGRARGGRALDGAGGGRGGSTIIVASFLRTRGGPARIRGASVAISTPARPTSRGGGELRASLRMQASLDPSNGHSLVGLR